MTHPDHECRSKAIVFHLMSAKFYVCQIDNLCFDSSPKNCSTVIKEEWSSYVHWCRQHNNSVGKKIHTLPRCGLIFPSQMPYFLHWLLSGTLPTQLKPP